MASRVENFSATLAGISFGKMTENQVEGICTYASWLHLTLSTYLWLIASVHLSVVLTQNTLPTSGMAWKLQHFVRYCLNMLYFKNIFLYTSTFRCSLKNM